MEGVDYSFDRPTAAGLAAAGKRFAVRYVGTPSSGKSLDAGEAQALRAAGVDVVATYETTAGFMAEGADGALAAARAVAHARTCGMPDGRPVYFALDVDPAGLTGLGWLSVERFLDDAAGVIGRDAVGIYGGYAAIERLVPGRARWGWQTYAWSGGRWSSKAHLTQYRNGVPLAGGTVDLCASKTNDFGQWGRTQEDDMGLTDTEKDWLDRELLTIRQKVETTYNQVNLRTGLVLNALKDIDLDVDEAEIAAAIVVAMPVDVLAAAIAEHLPDEDQSALLDALAARLAS